MRDIRIMEGPYKGGIHKPHSLRKFIYVSYAYRNIFFPAHYPLLGKSLYLFKGGGMASKKGRVLAKGGVAASKKGITNNRFL